MPIIDNVGRKNPKIILIFAIMYILLILGGITMVYPFIIMLGSATTNEVDYKDMRMIPKYINDDEALFRKYLLEKYGNPNPNIEFINERYGANYLGFEFVKKPDLSGINVKAVEADWYDFSRNMPQYMNYVGFKRVGNSSGIIENKYRKWLDKKFNSSISDVNRTYLVEYAEFSTIRSPIERWQDRGFVFDKNTFNDDFIEFKKTLDISETFPTSGDGPFQRQLFRLYDEKIEKLNAKYKTNYKAFSEIILAKSIDDTDLKADWEKYVRDKMPLKMILLDPKAEGLFQQYLEKRHKKISQLNEIWQLGKSNYYRSFKDIKILSNIQLESRRGPLLDESEFISKSLPIRYIKIETIDTKYRDYVEKKYLNISAVNAAQGTKYSSFKEIMSPVALLDWQQFKAKEKFFRWYFLTKNYREVSEYILLHGRAVGNTTIYVLAIIFVTLTVNPMCAYALSRFKLSYANNVLLFLLATMAFPAEVGMIPGFLLLKNFNMLNTFWALILPGLANGFSIFILKGFFDSLPKEFYEAAEMDGASELKIFMNITLPLAKPVLAYLALGAFTGAYGAFMFAMLVCQNQSMWTIMVFLYQMWEWAPTHLQMAALVISSLPTLIIFTFAQRVIMRGIIIPVQH